MPELDFLSEYDYDNDNDNDCSGGARFGGLRYRLSTLRPWRLNDNDNDCSGGARFGGLRYRSSTLRPTALAPWSGHRRVEDRKSVV